MLNRIKMFSGTWQGDLNFPLPKQDKNDHGGHKKLKRKRFLDLSQAT